MIVRAADDHVASRHRQESGLFELPRVGPLLRRPIPLLVAVLLAVSACLPLSDPTPTPAPTIDEHTAREVDRSIPVREANGLRADRAWVEAIVLSEASVPRFGILVSADEARAIDDRQVRDAIAFRRSVGMRDDEGWVREVHADPGAQTRYGVRMSPAEAAAMDLRTQIQADVPPAIIAYGERHPDDWAGMYVAPSGAGVVVLFSDDVEEHRAAVLSLFAPDLVEIEVRRVRWSLQELQNLNEQLWTSEAQAWLAEQDVRGKGGGPGIAENDVWLSVRIAAPDPTLVDRIVEHFDGRAWLRVEVTVVPALALPFGRLEVTVLDRAGTPVSGVRCRLLPTVVGAGGDNVFRDTDATGVCVWGATHAAPYGIEVWRRFEQGLLGTGSVTVPADGTGQVTIVVDPGAQ